MDLQRAQSERRVQQKDDFSEFSTECGETDVASDNASERTVIRSEDGHLADLEQQLSETRAQQFERDQDIARLTSQLSTLLEQTETKKEKEHAGLEQHGQQARPDEHPQSRDQVHEQARLALERANRAVEINEQTQREMLAELEARKSQQAALDSRVTFLENGSTNSKADSDEVQRRLMALEEKLELMRTTAITIQTMVDTNE